MGEQFTLVANNFIGDPNRYEGVDEDDLIGGAELSLYRMGQVLLEMGHDVRILQEATGATVDSINGIKVTQVPVPDTNPRLRRLTFNLRYPRYVPNGSYIHLHSDELALPRYRGINSINQQGMTWDYPGRRNIATRIKLKFLRKAIDDGAYVRASDNSFLSYVQSEWTDCRNRVYPIPNGVDLTTFRPSPVDSSNVLGSDITGPVILFPRTLRVARGAHIFIDAMAKLCRAGLPGEAVFLGARRNDLSTEINRRIQDRGIQNRVHFAGHVSNDRMSDYYNAADVVTIPTYHSEGSSIACIEAMACGRPVVVTDVGGLKDLVYLSETDGGIKTKPTSKSLFRALKRLVTDPALRDRLGERARERAERYYTIERWRDAMKEYFCRVIQETKPQ